jgi:hypothetical protein
VEDGICVEYENEESVEVSIGSEWWTTMGSTLLLFRYSFPVVLWMLLISIVLIFSEERCVVGPLVSVYDMKPEYQIIDLISNCFRASLLQSYPLLMSRMIFDQWYRFQKLWWSVVVGLNLWILLSEFQHQTIFKLWGVYLPYYLFVLNQVGIVMVNPIDWCQK